jgi:AraC family transcriptional regulator of adaptative response/methylated-DNA-[protein]-cysteine methyltransferase
MNLTANQRIIRYTIVPCSLGRLLLAATPRGVCAVSLGDRDGELLDFLRGEFPDREMTHDAESLRGWANAVVQLLEGWVPVRAVPTDVQATPFQQRVWQALCAIPPGLTRSYREIAVALGQPSAARAVARACATNPIAVIVPCHRVIRADGSISGYRWGVQRKQAILEREKRQVGR